MIRVHVSPRAEADLNAQIDWLAARAPGAAIRVSEALFAAIRGLADFPEVAPEIDGGGRELTVRFGRYGFIVRYRVYGDTVTIERVYHGRQAR